MKTRKNRDGSETIMTVAAVPAGIVIILPDGTRWTDSHGREIFPTRDSAWAAWINETDDPALERARDVARPMTREEQNGRSRRWYENMLRGMKA